MILYLTATAAVIFSSAYVLSAAERQAYAPVPQGMIPRGILRGRVFLAGIFAILFLILALRVNVGNDYAKYVEFMHLARFGGYVPTEPGFNLLAWVSYRFFGKEHYLFCFAFMGIVTVACFLFALDRLSEHFFESFAMFMLLGYYFQSISTVRYYLALAVVSCGIVCLLKDDLPRFVLLVLFAASFHKSALVVLILYPLAKCTFSKWFLAVLTAAGAGAFLLREQVLRLVLFLYPTYRETAYAAGGEGSLVSILRCVAVLALAAFVDRRSFHGRREPGEEAGIRMRRFYCHCSLLALYLYLFTGYIPVVSRIGYYLTFTQIFYLPMLIRRIPGERVRRIAACGAVLCCLGFFVLLMRHAGDDGMRILPYQTFFFHEMPPILSDMGYQTGG